MRATVEHPMVKQEYLATWNLVDKQVKLQHPSNRDISIANLVIEGAMAMINNQIKKM